MTDAPDIREPAAVDAAWLTRILQANGVDAMVQSFTAKNVGTGQIGDSVRFALSYARRGDGAPDSLVGKFPSSGAESRATGTALGNYLREVNFYKHLAPKARINTPRCWFADIDPATHAFSLIMEDLAPAAQGDQIAGVTLEQTRLVLEQSAKLHASHWRDESLAELPWLQGSTAAASPVNKEMVAAMWGAFCDRYGERVTPLAKQIGAGIADTFGDPDERTGPRCLMHNDFRPDNMMFATPAGGHPVTTLDWQTAGIGRGGADVAYFLGGAIPADVRRQHERALLEVYHTALAAEGAGPYPAEDFALDYIAGGFQLFLTAFFAAMVVTRTARGDDMFFVMLNGAAQLIEDSGALAT